MPHFAISTLQITIFTPDNSNIIEPWIRYICESELIDRAGIYSKTNSSP